MTVEQGGEAAQTNETHEGTKNETSNEPPPLDISQMEAGGGGEEDEEESSDDVLFKKSAKKKYYPPVSFNILMVSGNYND